ncbi:MAG: tetratricopeptide repeat protein [candidate division Zixibacteria bacterium]|nr:tetratricopeptide repeat protein [candidate division Zixibacteria bacterium]
MRLLTNRKLSVHHVTMLEPSRYKSKFNMLRASILLLVVSSFLISTQTVLAYAPLTDLLMAGKIEEANQLLSNSDGNNLSEETKEYYKGVLEFNGKLSADFLRESLRGDKDFTERSLSVLRLAQYYYSIGFYVTCVNYLEEFEQNGLNSKYIDQILWLRGFANMNAGRYEEAKSDFSRLIDSYPSSDMTLWGFLGIGYCYYKEGDLSSAIKSFERVKDTDTHPAFPQSLLALSTCYKQIGNSRRTEHYLDIYNRKYPGSFIPDMDLAAEPMMQFDIPLQQSDMDAEELVQALYFIQVGSFSSRQNAQRMMNRLEQKGYNSTREAFYENRKIFYRILVGPYTNRGEARKHEKKLESSEGDDFIIILR